METPRRCLGNCTRTFKRGFKDACVSLLVTYACLFGRRLHEMGVDLYFPNIRRNKVYFQSSNRSWKTTKLTLKKRFNASYLFVCMQSFKGPSETLLLLSIQRTVLFELHFPSMIMAVNLLLCSCTCTTNTSRWVASLLMSIFQSPFISVFSVRFPLKPSKTTQHELPQQF